MIRLMLLLCAGLFGALLILGEDHGQRRAGLTAADAGPQPESTSEAAPRGTAARIKAPRPPLNLPDQPVMRAAADPIAEAVAAEVAAAMAPKMVAAEVVAAAETPAGKLRWIGANSVNVRAGPSTEFPVLDKLNRGEAVLVVLEDGGAEGWSRVRIEGDGVEGFVASRFLTDAQP